MDNLDQATPATHELVAFVTETLRSSGHENPSGWEAFLPRHFATAGSNKERLFHINVALSDVLGSITDTVDTLPARLSLDDNVSVADWKTLFVKGVVPWLIKYKLPPLNA